MKTPVKYAAKYTVGIDEVGRGPLAGPVTVCLVMCKTETYEKLKKNKDLPKSGKDSKKLTSIEREKYSNILKKLRKDKQISYALLHISNKIIDSQGISFAIRKAMEQGIAKLKISPKDSNLLLDGSLYAPKEFLKQKTIIKGDEKEKIISWASILAKVSRDSLMSKFALKFPNYGLEKHKGYGTEMHRKAIKIHGISVLHRVTFCRNI
jgi:ribonuclease HII